MPPRLAHVRLATAGIGDAVHQLPSRDCRCTWTLNAYGISGGPDLPGFVGGDAMRAALPGASQSPNKPYLLEIGNNGYDQYTLEYAACNDHATDDMVSMVSVWHDVIARAGASGAGANLRQIMILNGDIDPVVDMRHQDAVRKMGFGQAGEAGAWFQRHGRGGGLCRGQAQRVGPTVRARAAGAQIGVCGRFGFGGPVELRFVSVRLGAHDPSVHAYKDAAHDRKGMVARKGSRRPCKTGGTAWPTTSGTTEGRSGSGSGPWAGSGPIRESRAQVLLAGVLNA